MARPLLVSTGSILSSFCLSVYVFLWFSRVEASRATVAESPSEKYVGAAACLSCHSDKRAQESSRHAKTWKLPENSRFGRDYQAMIAEGDANPVRYQVKGQGGRVSFEVNLAEAASSETVRIHSVLGGDRIGESFILELETLQGRKLPHPTLIEARYMHSAETGKLVKSPGLSFEPPENYETALGRPLSSRFGAGQHCFRCHGGTVKPDPQEPSRHPDFGQVGVRCERCHGPGRDHIRAVKEGSAELRIVHPGKLPPEHQMRLCAECHSGLEPEPSPLPENLLISSQAAALVRSECYIESNGALKCVNCHNPHLDARPDDPIYEQTCRACHGLQLTAAVHCSVNPRKGCIDCHMPRKATADHFKLVDHWIRVFQEQVDVPFRKTSRPTESRRYFLRMIVVPTESQIRDIYSQVTKGASFAALARQQSVDPSREDGGFLGELHSGQMNRTIREVASTLQPGQVSRPFRLGREFALIQKMPEDFDLIAMAHYRKGWELFQKGQLDQAIKRYEEAIAIYPHLVRGLFHLGVAYGEKGWGEKAASVYLKAIKLDSNYAPTHFNLAQLHVREGRIDEGIESFKRTIEADPDTTAAYLNLGTIYAANGKLEAALGEFQKATELDPLLPSAQFNLGLALLNQQRYSEAIEKLELAVAIHPKMAKAYHALAAANRHQGNTEQARRHLKRAKELGLSVDPVLERDLGLLP